MAGPAIFIKNICGKMKSIESYLGKIKNKKLLVIFPHPDDEVVMAGGLILKALEMGYWVTVLTLTEGDRGKIHIHGRGRSVAEIRREEEAKAMSILGVADWAMWKFDDGKLCRGNRWRKQLTDFVEDTNPGIVVTYDLSGVSGHPDHISVSLEILQLARKRKSFKLLWTSFVGEMKEKIVDKRVEKYLQGPDLFLDLNLIQASKKWQSVFAHRSQNLKEFLKSPWWKLIFFSRREWYSEAGLGKKYKYRFMRFRI